MINIGLIGDIKLLEPYTSRVQQHKKVHIIGKSSVGTQPLPSSFSLQAPEFNRIELIERSDALFINKFSLLPFPLICDIIKKSKHIFAASYPDLTPDELSQLIKLANEARCIVHVANPYYYLPGIDWLANKIKKPASIQVVLNDKTETDKKTLIRLLLMLKDFTGAIPRKTCVSNYFSSPIKAEYKYIHLEYNDGSIINYHLQQMEDKGCFQTKIYMQDQFLEFDFSKNKYTMNGLNIDVTDKKSEDEAVDFLDTLIFNRKPATGLNNYLEVIQLYNIINERLQRFN